MADQGDADAYNALLRSLAARALLKKLGPSGSPTNSSASGNKPGVLSDLFGSVPAAPTNPHGLGAFSDLFGLPPSSPPQPSGLLSGLGGLGVPSSPLGGLLRGSAAVAPTKRRTFFSFHYADIMRVNNVRKSGEFKTSSGGGSRDVEGFYDGSLWESRKLEGPEAVKNLIRDGVRNTSTVCVLAGSETWSRRWVRYEIARAIIDGRGLLTVHINSLRHHQHGFPHLRGPNPLNYMAVGAVTQGLVKKQYFLFEFTAGGWYRYGDYTRAVDLPSWLPEPSPGKVTPLSDAAAEYDYVTQVGHQNIGSWIDVAAIRAGR